MRAVALAAALGAVLVTGCEGNFGGDGDEEDQTQGAVDGADDADGADEGEDDGAEPAETDEAAPVEPPTEPADISPAGGDRSASDDGSTITVEGGPAAFVSPTGTIACVVNELSATCQISDKTYQPGSDQIVGDVIGDCSADDADTLVLSTAGGAWTCPPEPLAATAALDAGGWWVDETGGEIDEVDGVDAAVLPYGQTLRVGPVSCTSQEDGMTCRSDEMGREFFLARSAYNYG